MLKSRRALRSGVFVAALLANLAVVPSALGMIHFTLGGSMSRNNIPYQTYLSRAGSASVAMDLGEYFRVSYSHRQEFSNTAGYRALESQPGYYGEYLSATRVISNSVDFNVILFAGDLFIPYLSAGAVVKAYYSDISSVEGSETSSFTLPASPNLGGGVGIRLDRNFSLKLSYTVSPGLKQEPGGTRKEILDSYAQMGVTYQM